MTQIPRLVGPRWSQEIAQRPTLPFYFIPSDGLLSPRSGQTVTFTRAGRTVALDADGRLYEVPNHLPATLMLDLDADGTRESAGLLLNGTANQFGKRVNDLADAQWTTSGTGSKTLIGTHGGLQLWRITDSDGAAAYTLLSAIDSSSMTNAQGYIFGCVVAKGTTAPSNASRLRIYDATAGTERGTFTFTWSGATPTFSPGTSVTLLCGTNGHYLGTDAGGRRLYLQMGLYTGTAFLKGNTNRLEFVVSTTAADTGKDVVVGAICGPMGGYTAWPYFNRGSVVTAPAVEQWSVPFDATPQAMTMYARYVNLGYHGTGKTYISLGHPTATGPRFYLAHNGTYSVCVFHDGSTSVTATANSSAPTVGFGSLVEVLGTISATGVVQATARVDGGTLITSSASAALALPAEWKTGGGATIELGHNATEFPYGAIVGAAVAWGAQSMDFMASFF